MPKKLVHFETLGCKLNQVESEGAARTFTDAGFSVSMEPYSAQTPENPDVLLCVLNTCTVTAKAEQKARRIIRLLLSKCPNSVVIITGCYAQLNQDDLLSMDSRIAVIGGQNKGYLADVPSILNENPEIFGLELKNLLQKFFDEKKLASKPNEIAEPFRLSTDSFLNHSRASLKIQDGCNCVCTYCRIRLARGKSVSLEASEVLRRVQELEAAGQKEVVITTVNISQYRSELKVESSASTLRHGSVTTGSTTKWRVESGLMEKGKVQEDGSVLIPVNFAVLLKLILDNTISIGIRISSLYPEIVDEEFGEIVSDSRVRPHFHISVQSGSDSVLSRMKRPYKIQAVFRACEILKKAKGNPFLACDIIAGFPGETDSDFDETMTMLEKCGFTFVHAFPFSPRPGTEAFKMRPMVPNYITDERIKRLEEFNRIHKTEYFNSFIGKVLPAVTENIHRAASKIVLKEKVFVHAVTENFIHCQMVFDSQDKNIPKPGSVVNAKILRLLEKKERTGESEVLAEL